MSYVVHDPLPQVRDWDLALGPFDPPDMLKLVVLMTRSRLTEPHAEHFISTWSSLLLKSISTSLPHDRHLNSYIGI
jgi:hypothetical protein